MEESNSTQKVIYSLVCVCLVLIGGVMSGLTLGLMSLDTVDLEVGRFVYQGQSGAAKRLQPTLPGDLGCAVRDNMQSFGVL